jgi:hypothetical protein
MYPNGRPLEEEQEELLLSLIKHHTIKMYGGVKVFLIISYIRIILKLCMKLTRQWIIRLNYIHISCKSLIVKLDNLGCEDGKHTLQHIAHSVDTGKRMHIVRQNIFRISSGDTAPHIFNFGTGYRWVVSFMPQLLYPWQRASGIHCIGGCVGTIAGLDALEKIIFPLLWIESWLPNCSTHSLVTVQTKLLLTERVQKMHSTGLGVQCNSWQWLVLGTWLLPYFPYFEK